VGFADLQCTQGNAEQAARLLGFIEPWLQSNKIQLVHFDRANYLRSVEAARAPLSEATFNAARAAGFEMTLEEAIASILRQT
jgi:hypothetical protein